MRKIPTLLKRDPDNMRSVLMEVNPGCEWVLAGEGKPTRKYDGTCVMLDEGGVWWRRREGIVWHHPDGRMAKLKGRDLR